MAALFVPQLFDLYAGRSTAIIIAVSGGGDSMALMDLYWQAKLQNKQLPQPHVVTVDHGLRQGFAAEAAIVETYCTKFDLPWQLVRWEGEKPKSGIMAAARLARYRLLAHAAQGVGAGIILTGHTLDDQNETAMMRGLRGPASRMDSDVLFERRAAISRPLLTISRAELRAYLALNTIAFADDPTNLDMRFERARIRADNLEAGSSPLEATARFDLVARSARFVLAQVKRDGDKVFIMRPQLRDNEAEMFALRYLAAALGGFEYPAPAGVVERLVQLLNEGQRSVAFTAQRCRFMRVEGGISVCQELRHIRHQWLHPSIAPFETFCGYSLLALANALAETLGAQHFILPAGAAI